MATKFRKQGLNCSMMVWKGKQKIDGRWFHLSAEWVQGQRRKTYTLLYSFPLALSSSLSLSDMNANLHQLHKICLVRSKQPWQNLWTHSAVVLNVNEGQAWAPPPTSCPLVVRNSPGGMRQERLGLMMVVEEWERYSWTNNKVTVKFALTGMHIVTQEH